MTQTIQILEDTYRREGTVTISEAGSTWYLDNSGFLELTTPTCCLFFNAGHFFECAEE